MRAEDSWSSNVLRSRLATPMFDRSVYAGTDILSAYNTPILRDGLPNSELLLKPTSTREPRL
jgi:hypothetical protein